MKALLYVLAAIAVFHGLVAVIVRLGDWLMRRRLRKAAEFLGSPAGIKQMVGAYKKEAE